MFDTEVIERPQAEPLFELQGYRKLTETLSATFAGFVQQDPKNDMGDVYAVVGCGRDDGNYFVPVTRSETVQAFVSEARKILNSLPDRGQMGTYSRQELELARKKSIDPTSDLYRALVHGVKAAHPSSNPQIL